MSIKLAKLRTMLIMTAIANRRGHPVYPFPNRAKMGPMMTNPRANRFSRKKCSEDFSVSLSADHIARRNIKIGKVNNRTDAMDIFIIPVIHATQIQNSIKPVYRPYKTLISSSLRIF